MCNRFIVLFILLLVVSARPLPLRADDFGVLLTSPKERLELDKLRRGTPALAEGKNVPPELSFTTLRGTLRRSGGAGATWINQYNTLDAPVTPEGVKVVALRPDVAGAALRLVDGGGGKFVLRVGQSRDVMQRRTIEVFDRSSELAPIGAAPLAEEVKAVEGGEVMRQVKKTGP